MAKLSKSEADYVPHAKAKHCRDCAMFRVFNGRCTLVEGAINDDGHCRYWKAKARLVTSQSG